MINPTLEVRFGLHYAALFGSIGATAPFVALWMSHAGISPSSIGTLVAAPSLLMLLTTVWLGRWADGLADRRQAIIIANVIILAAHLPLFVHTGVWLLAPVWVLAGVALFAVVPITDAATLAMAARRGSDFARIRMWGSIGYIIGVTLAGLTYEQIGIAVFLYLLVAGDASRLLLAGTLPRLAAVLTLAKPNPPLSAEPVTLSASCSGAGLGHAQSARKTVVSLYHPGVLLTLAGSALVISSHACVNTFGILLWTRQGLSEGVASLAVAIGVLAEIGLLFSFRTLTRNISARTLLIFCAACGLVRWAVLASTPSLFWLFAVQLLHGVTFGMTYVATAGFISRRVTESDAARGQSLSATMAMSLTAAATLLLGALFDAGQEKLFWLMSLSCAAAIGALQLSRRFPVDDALRR